MSEWISFIGIFTACSVVVGIAALITMHAVEVIYGYFDQFRYDRWELHTRQRAADLARWCSYEYPIVEDIGKFFAEGLDTSTFRDGLRRKYPPPPSKE